MERFYLVRYGSTAQVGRFAADSPHRRGEAVVVRSHRGTELGEVLVEAPAGRLFEGTPVDGLARVLRAASQDDVERARRAGDDRPVRFEACRRVLGEGVWPVELVDVEPLLDDRRTVLHYLGPHRLDTAGLLAVFREALDLDVMFQPVGRDVPDEELDGPDAEEAVGGCGDCGAGGGGCGSGGCGTGGGCGDCGVKKLISSRG